MIQSYLSKSSLLSWVKDTTGLPAPNLEELSTGVHFCVLLHILTKEKFMVNKVNYKAKLEHQSLHNLRQFQYGLQNNGILNKFEINKIAAKNIKAILDTLQWFRKEYVKRDIVDRKGLDNGKKVVIKVRKGQTSQEAASLPLKKELPQENFVETENIIKSLGQVQLKESLGCLQPSQYAQAPQASKQNSEHNPATKNEAQSHAKQQKMANDGPQNMANSSAKNQQSKPLISKSSDKAETGRKESAAGVPILKKSILKVQAGENNPRVGNVSTSVYKVQFDTKTRKSGDSFFQKIEKSVLRSGEQIRQQKITFNVPASITKSEERNESKRGDRSESNSKYSNLLSSHDTSYRTQMI